MTIPASQFLEASPAEQDQVLGALFERCETLNSFIRSALAGPIASYPEMIETVRARLLALLDENRKSEELGKQIDPRIDAIVAAHPRLGAKEPLLTHSLQEQASLAGEGAALAELNREYEAVFPGLRYVVFVNGRPRAEIIPEMRDRISRGDVWRERHDAFNAMCDIALSRL